MTGRELIIYILENGLEDEEVFKDGKILGYCTVEQAAVRMSCGTATILTWIDIGLLDNCILINDNYLIPEKSLVRVMERTYIVK